MSGLRTLRHGLAASPVGRQVRRARRRAAIVRQTGRLHPDHIALAATGHRIYVDPTDRRGRTIVDGLGRGHQPALIALWRAAIDATRPALVVDVGANYGEFVLNARYPPGTRAIAVEANHRLVPILERSVAAHPDAARIEIRSVLATDTDEGTEVLRVDPGWSGSAATALDRARDGARLETTQVARRTIDSLVGEPIPTGALVLKIDTEGSEWQVIAGAERLLAGAAPVVALVEFDPAHLTRQGTDPAALFARLARIGRCWTVAWDGTSRLADGPPGIASDLVVVSASDTAAALALPTR